MADKLKQYLVFDVESAGLYGKGFAFGYCVVDEKGKEIDAQFATSGIDSVQCSPDDLKWLKKNIPNDILYPEGQFKLTRAELKASFKAILKKYKDAMIFADCGYPVEARWLLACGCEVYPLHELATILMASGEDPVGKFPRLENEKPEHHPLCDARQSARLLIKYLAPISGKRHE